MSNYSGFKSIKKIIKNIKNEINDFQEKIENIWSSRFYIKKNNLNPIETNNNDSNSSNLFNPNVSLSNNQEETRKEKINSFTRERAKRILEVKKQLNFLDGILIGNNLDKNYKNPDYLKLSSFQEILRNDELNSNRFENSTEINKNENKEKILNNLIKEINEVSVDLNENTSTSQDFVITHDFLENLKSQGKEISENFVIKEKENVLNNGKDDYWLTEFEDELKTKTNTKETEEKNLINLIYKK